jgi:hypothetical protein
MHFLPGNVPVSTTSLQPVASHAATVLVAMRRATRLRIAPILSLFLVTALVAGCSDGRPDRVPVSGQVLIDGAPLKRGYVRFVPKGARPSGGKLDENGRFTLESYDGGDGAVVGTHQISVAASEYVSASQTRWHAPKKYADYNASGLHWDIDGPTDSVVLNLTWAGDSHGKPYIEGPPPRANNTEAMRGRE